MKKNLFLALMLILQMSTMAEGIVVPSKRVKESMASLNKMVDSALVLSGPVFYEGGD